MKKKLGLFVFALVCVFGVMAVPAKAETNYCGKGVYASRQYFEWSFVDQCYIVKLDSRSLNVRETPSINGKIIGKLYNGDKVRLDHWGCNENGFMPIIIL